MANTDILKFKELLTADAGFQEKFKKAAESYSGAPDVKSVFDNVLLPLGKEYGLSATFDEFKGYMDSLGNRDGELSDDELAQVAGGKADGTNASAAVAAVAAVANAGSIAGIYCKGIGFHD